MRKTITLLLLLCAFSFYAYSATVYVDGLRYDTDTSNYTASLKGYSTAPSGELIIPTSITVESSLYRYFHWRRGVL